MSYKNYEELALDLLDFVGGSTPTLSELNTWALRRELHELSETDKRIILQTAEQLLINP
jgi:hypothetical protein